MTDAERKLWYMLRDRRFSGAKFRRQVPLGRYVADFLSFENQVVIEVDGSQHSGRASDIPRDKWFRTQGFTVLRLWNNDVLTNLEGVATLLLSPGADRASALRATLSHKGRGERKAITPLDKDAPTLSREGRG
jgi:very-short-patch-repair endonuclease